MNNRKRILIAALIAVSSQPAISQTGAQAIGEVILPPELIAEYACVTYAEGTLRSRVEDYAKSRLGVSNDKPKALRSAVGTYASLLRAMCADVQVQLQSRRNEVSSMYAAQLPGNNHDISMFLKNHDARRWASDNVALLRKTASLIELYQFATEVAPQLFDHPRPTLDSATVSEISATSVGIAAQGERRWLALLLKDTSFARYAPEGIDLELIAREEERLRRDSSKLMYATEFGWFNGNANDLVTCPISSAQ